MRLIEALLCLEARTYQDGTFSATNAGIEIVYAPFYPWRPNVLSFLLGVEAGPEDYGKEHRVEIEYQADDGERFALATLNFPLPIAAQRGRRATRWPALEQTGATFGSVGDGQFRVSVNDDDPRIVPVSFRLGQSPTFPGRPA